MQNCNVTFILSDLLQKRTTPSTVTLQDMRAVNGSYLLRQPVAGVAVKFTEANRIKAGTTLTLEDGDVIRFGLYNSCYRVIHVPLLVATSMIKSPEQVHTSLLVLGASYSRDWSEKCTHLVMDDIQLSAKVSHFDIHSELGNISFIK